MNLIICLVILIFKVVTGAPFLLDRSLLKEGHPMVSALHYASYTYNEGLGSEGEGHLRYLYLVPTYDHVSHFRDGVGSGPPGHDPLVHSKLTPDYQLGERMTELVGLSDCKSWHAVVVGVWLNDLHTFKYFSATHKDNKWKYNYHSDLESLVEFVKGKLYAEHLRELLAKGVGSHLFLQKLAQQYGNLL
ncbi:hypothetical protein TpMuguga_03g00113 [Theileria parva strain Muguga]|uniref:Uncharacterized protein n=1 Tax=Theileria parva TaxID=5875 RepID=Q4N0K8_THEPA|nr:uncharacterized protein TpMuguga_03g00113 [Theileria parva strain Muguga]EAN30848.1 hypothetical protein TpMuguga_03g00113 [Theileria parva strain Muguga]|eukprot:XP_763131.1 hypothetical protein [Theileria parva strain Muguga]